MEFTFIGGLALCPAHRVDVAREHAPWASLCPRPLRCRPCHEDAGSVSRVGCPSDQAPSMNTDFTDSGDYSSLGFHGLFGEVALCPLQNNPSDLRDLRAAVPLSSVPLRLGGQSIRWAVSGPTSVKQGLPVPPPVTPRGNHK